MRVDSATLLRLHNNAYALLIHLGQLARDEPAWLSPSVVRALSNGRSAAAWIAERRSELPESLLPEPAHEASFGCLVASFLETSFHVEHQWYNETLHASYLRTGTSSVIRSRISELQIVALAVRHLLSHEGVQVAPHDASLLADRADIHVETRIIAYVWELDRRSRGKGKGPVVHALWKAIPKDVRKTLNEDVVWLAYDVVRSNALAFESTRLVGNDIPD